MIPLRNVYFPFSPLKLIQNHSLGLYAPYKKPAQIFDIARCLVLGKSSTPTWKNSRPELKLADNPKNCPLPRRPGPPSNIYSLGPPDLAPNGISTSSAVFAGLTNVTDRHADRPRYSVYSNKSLSLRCGVKSEQM